MPHYSTYFQGLVDVCMIRYVAVVNEDNLRATFCMIGTGKTKDDASCIMNSLVNESPGIGSGR